MSPENNEPEPTAGEPGEAAAELALDEALAGEPVDENGRPLEPLVAEPAAEEAPAGEAPAEEAAAEEAPAEESPAEEP
ncbi:MAG TPA: SMC-Scp complex subunit ScpB, partial [Amycolatopsis sp.]